MGRLTNKEIRERFGNDMSRAVAYGRGQRDFLAGRYKCGYHEEQLQADYRDGYHSRYSIQHVL